MIATSSQLSCTLNSFFFLEKLANAFETHTEIFFSQFKPWRGSFVGYRMSEFSFKNLYPLLMPNDGEFISLYIRLISISLLGINICFHPWWTNWIASKTADILISKVIVRNEQNQTMVWGLWKEQCATHTHPCPDKLHCIDLISIGIEMLKIFYFCPLYFMHFIQLCFNHSLPDFLAFVRLEKS